MGYDGLVGLVILFVVESVMGYLNDRYALSAVEFYACLVPLVAKRHRSLRRRDHSREHSLIGPHVRQTRWKLIPRIILLFDLHRLGLILSSSSQLIIVASGLTQLHLLRLAALRVQGHPRGVVLNALFWLGWLLLCWDKDHVDIVRRIEFNVSKVCFLQL